ncbi:MAG: DUF5320 domain-containing protein [Anaerolineales bacterium]|nr:DUF5320 domain-containing protein [Anaerolineales bacterium]
MPRGDRTGPTGMGPMTGRGLGYCSGSGAPGYAAPGPGRGMGMGGGRGFGMGRGRGWRNMYYATGLPAWARSGPYAAPYQTPDPEWEKQALKNQSDALQAQLEQIRKRLEDLESDRSGK